MRLLGVVQTKPFGTTLWGPMDKRTPRELYEQHAPGALRFAYLLTGDLDLDPIERIRHSKPPDLSRTRDRAKKADDEERRFVDDTKGELENQVQEVDSQRQAAKDWAEDSKDEVENQSEEIEDQKDEVEDQKEWAECYVTNEC